jgi:hypothetical protein
MRFPNTRNNLVLLDLTVMLGRLLFVVLSVQQVSYIAKLLGSRLERFDLLSKLRLLGLLFAENLVDISHGNCLLSAIYVPVNTSSTNGVWFVLRA